MPTVTLAYSIPLAVVAGMFLFLVARRWVPALRMIGGPVENAALRRAEIAENELERANAEIEKLERTNTELEKERSLSAVVEQVTRVAAGVDQMLAKLADMNGGMKHAQSGLEEAATAIKASTTAIEFLASQIITDIRRQGS